MSNILNFNKTAIVILLKEQKQLFVTFKLDENIKSDNESIGILLEHAYKMIFAQLYSLYCSKSR